jgi:hypothetical protein
MTKELLLIANGIEVEANTKNIKNNSLEAVEYLKSIIKK